MYLSLTQTAIHVTLYFFLLLMLLLVMCDSLIRLIFTPISPQLFSFSSSFLLSLHNFFILSSLFLSSLPLHFTSPSSSSSSSLPHFSFSIFLLFILYDARDWRILENIMTVSLQLGRFVPEERSFQSILSIFLNILFKITLFLSSLSSVL